MIWYDGDIRIDVNATSTKKTDSDLPAAPWSADSMVIATLTTTLAQSPPKVMADYDASSMLDARGVFSERILSRMV